MLNVPTSLATLRVTATRDTVVMVLTVKVSVSPSLNIIFITVTFQSTIFFLFSLWL